MSQNGNLSKEDIINAQSKWGNGIVQIGADFMEKKITPKRPKTILNIYTLMIFRPSLFKAAEDQFRSTKDTALSYFVATNGACSEDKGFAIQPWTKVRFENSDIVIHVAMGNYFFTDTDGVETKVEYSFGYLLDSEGNVRINLHHSSLPFSA